MPIEIIKTSRRCCPECSSTEFYYATCDVTCKVQQKGYRLVCTACKWKGFRLQLVETADARQTTLPELSASLARQAARSCKQKEE